MSIVATHTCGNCLRCTSVVSGEQCDRKQDHPGFCMKRCAKTEGCRDRSGHRGQCSESRYLEWGWALPVR